MAFSPLAKSGMLKDRDFEEKMLKNRQSPNFLRQIRKGSAKSTRWEPEVFGTVSDRNRK